LVHFLDLPVAILTAKRGSRRRTYNTTRQTFKLAYVDALWTILSRSSLRVVNPTLSGSASPSHAVHMAVSNRTEHVFSSSNHQKLLFTPLYFSF